MANTIKPIGSIPAGSIPAAPVEPPKPPEIVSLEPEVIIQQLTTELLKLAKETVAYKIHRTTEYTVQYPNGEQVIIKLKPPV